MFKRAAHPTACEERRRSRGKSKRAAYPTACGERGRSRGKSKRAAYSTACKEKGARLVRPGEGESRFQAEKGKKGEKRGSFPVFFVDSAGNGIVAFEQAGGAGEAFVGRKKSVCGGGGGGVGSGAAVCGLILSIGGRGGVIVFVVGGG